MIDEQILKTIHAAALEAGISTGSEKNTTVLTGTWLNYLKGLHRFAAILTADKDRQLAERDEVIEKIMKTLTTISGLAWEHQVELEESAFIAVNIASEALAAANRLKKEKG